MKKLFTLIAAALMTVGANADEVVLMENVSDGNVLNIADIEAAGGADSDVVTFYLEDNTGTDHTGWGMGGFGPSTGWDTPYEFTGGSTSWTQTTTVAEIKEIAGAASGIRFRLYNGVELVKVTLLPSKTYETTGKSLTIQDGGNIFASEFAGYSDDAKVIFTSNITGSEGFVGWGYGKLTSIGGEVTVTEDFKVEGDGEHSVTLLLKDLKDALLAPGFYEDDDTKEKVPMESGLSWNVWGFNDGACTATRVSVVIFEISGFDGEGFVPTSVINAVNAEKNVNAPIYNLSGQRVDAQYKGVVIQNGKKFLQK